MKNDDWYTFSEAGRRVGKSRAWLSAVKDKHPEYFENVDIKRLGRSLVISQSGLDTVLKQIKKQGDHVRSSILVWSTKQICPLLLPHFNLNIFQSLKSFEKFLEEIIRIFKLLIYTNLVLV